jgi:hypothetical protein
MLLLSDGLNRIASQAGNHEHRWVASWSSRLGDDGVKIGALEWDSAMEHVNVGRKLGQQRNGAEQQERFFA